jgi:hypothetical protein
MRGIVVALLLTVIAGLQVHAQDVYKTPSGKKYHLASCRMVENVSEKISIQKAVELGLEPCKICKPDFLVKQTVTNKKLQGQNTTVQCKGYTKADARCKHMTSIGNGYCYQHQP